MIQKVEKQLFDERSAPARCNEHYESTSYLECRFWGSRFKKCEWSNCKLKRVKFAHGVEFHDCKFRKTRFDTAHTWLTGTFKNCIFEDCVFAATSVGDATFENCIFSGKIQSMIFYGKKAPKNLQVVLKNVDFSKVVFIDTDFRMQINLNTVKMPDGESRPLIEGE